MKSRISKLLFSLAALPLLLLTGCNDDASTAMWWLPHPWSPAGQFFTPDQTNGGGDTSGGGGGGGGGMVGGRG